MLITHWKASAARTPVWQGVSPVLAFCLEHADWETCQNTPAADETNNEPEDDRTSVRDAIEFVDGVLEESDEGEDIFEGVTPEDIFIIDEPEQLLPGEEQEEISDEEAERELDEADAERDRACANLARLTALREGLEFELASADRDHEEFLRMNPEPDRPNPGEPNASDLEYAALERASALLSEDIRTYVDSGQAVPELLLQQSANLSSALDKAFAMVETESAEYYNDVVAPYNDWQETDGIHRGKLAQILQRTALVEQEIEETPTDCD